MKEWFTKLWKDASFFDRLIRTALMAVGSGMLAASEGPWFKGIGAAFTAAAVFIPAGERNPKPPEA